MKGFGINTTTSGIKCIYIKPIFESEDNTFEENRIIRMSRVLKEKLYQQSYGAIQYDCIECMIDFGSIYNIGSKRNKQSLDTLIDRVQKMLVKFNNVWKTDFEVLYGKLDDNNFGYYLRSATLEEM
jgi:hypothetical protein